jgi:hypothetical protein
LKGIARLLSFNSETISDCIAGLASEIWDGMMDSACLLFRNALSSIGFLAVDLDELTETGAILRAARFAAGPWKKDDTEDTPSS